MTRDFSDAAKEKLIQQIKAVTPNGFFGKALDFFGDLGLTLQEKYGELNIQSYANDVDTYHKKILDKNNTEISKIEEIFAAVHEVDESASGTLTPLGDAFEQQRGKISRLLDTLTISPSRFKPDTIQAIRDGSKNPGDYKVVEVRNYDQGVERGSIRYVNQYSVYNSQNGWRPEHQGGMSNGQCNWAVESMAYSYLGIDVPPSEMHDSERNRRFELALGFKDGDSATFQSTDGPTTVTVHGGWGSFDRGRLDSMVSNYANDAAAGNHSPVMLYYSGPDGSHWILVTGKNPDGSYHAIGPWSNNGSDYERAGFDVRIADDGTVSGSGFGGCSSGRKVGCIAQYERTD